MTAACRAPTPFPIAAHPITTTGGATLQYGSYRLALPVSVDATNTTTVAATSARSVTVNGDSGAWATARAASPAAAYTPSTTAKAARRALGSTAAPYAAVPYAAVASSMSSLKYAGGLSFHQASVTRIGGA